MRMNEEARSRALAWGQFLCVPPRLPGLPSRLLLGFSGRATQEAAHAPSARPATQQALGVPSSPAAPRCSRGGFCGCLLPSRFPGAPVCPSWVVVPVLPGLLPTVSPVGSEPRLLPTCPCD